MERNGIEISVVSNMNGIFYKDTNASNEELIAELNSDKRFRNRFIPFGIVNPIYAGWKNDLENCVKSGMKGIRFYPQYHDYELSDPLCIELVNLAKSKGLVVAFTVRMVDSRPRHWMDLSKEWTAKDYVQIIKAVPDAKYFILNSGAISLNDEETEILKKSNVLIDTSGRGMNNLNALMGRFGKEKFAFGTHSPILDYMTGRLRIESLRDSEADEATKEQLRSGNAKRILMV
jgi:predicted TIM-barrel fold metal-dependent hydrolase